MRSSSELKAADPARLKTSIGEPQIHRSEIPSPELSRFLYTAVGGPWHWLERLPWTWDEWMTWLEAPGVETWYGTVRGTPFGYGELHRAPGGEVELVYFGLLPRFIGCGLGGWLLTEVVRRAWQSNPRRVWLHTCDLDGPTAIANYTARGFHVYRTETETRSVPAQPPGPWPGAHQQG
ncbi:MAG: GNAT family N-acetyltransferase [Spirochaetaceae bacterium]|nr:MAG: GNAT family N-acetyltransferase [Spirochaetaceae bacterium]